MKIIHTADWHLCTKLGRIDRTADLEVRVERVAAYCEEHQVDVLVVAGDLFCDRASNEQMTASFRHLHKTFRPFFARGGILLGVTGNHDRDNKLDLMRAGMMLANPVNDRHLQPGRMYLFNSTIVVEANGKDGKPVQFVCIPYPYLWRYEIDAAKHPSREEQFRALRYAIVDWMKTIAADKATLNPALPTVLVAHLHVRGSEIHSTYQLNPGDDIEFEFASLNPGWQYIALGHIHKPQMLGGSEHVRYSGSLDRLDFGEQGHGHGALLVTIDGGTKATPVHLPIPCTPFAVLRLDDPACDLHAWAAGFPDRDDSITLIRPAADSADRAGVQATLKLLFPRLLRVDWPDEEEAKPSADGINAESATPAAIIRAYLETQLPADDPERSDLLQLAQQYLTDGGDA